MVLVVLAVVVLVLSMWWGVHEGTTDVWFEAPAGREGR